MVFDYAAVAREAVILSQYAITGGNYDLNAGDVLSQVGSETTPYQDPEANRTYYVLRGDGGLNFLVVCHSETPIEDAYLFLSRLQTSFLSSSSARSWRSAAPYALQTEFSDQIRELMAGVAEWANPDAIELGDWDQEAPLLDLKTEEETAIPEAHSILHRRWWQWVGVVATFLLVIILVIAVR
jgi:hypothetical protein